MARNCCRRITSPGACHLHGIITILLVLATVINNAGARNYALPSICLQPPPRSEGLCTMEIEGFYFDQRVNDCLLYSVGGCRVSAGQSFGKRQDCIETCMRGTRNIQDMYINE